jgi:hypothetical protein
MKRQETPPSRHPLVLTQSGDWDSILLPRKSETHTKHEDVMLAMEKENGEEHTRKSPPDELARWENVN